MKANKKFIEEDERAVSAVIGVILMVSITVAIAAIVYVYVSGELSSKSDVVICGKISDMPDKDTTDILKMNNNIYIVKTSWIDTEYMLMKYAFEHNCSCSLILQPSNDANVYYIKYGSVSLLDCGCLG
jgi:hypothetical protein